ncbi:MAG: heterodisulfide reductase-related iron-sulfur binding cluster [Armatimonadota bacterium]|nr:heterodisulfide reductase-related iron-sulfur binding cluster [Armatimonadota bacterium]
MTVDDRLLDCVHCGFCLPTCPTYAELGLEMDSPRGRLYLIRALADRQVSYTRRLVAHLDGCLDCRACETACPSGVRYGALLEEARHAIRGGFTRSSHERAIQWLVEQVFPYPQRLRWLLQPARLTQRLGLSALLRARLREMMELLPPKTAVASVPPLTPARGTRRLRVGFLTGCAARVLCPEMNAAMVNVLARNGCEVVAPAAQGCCGALHLHSGAREQARLLARHNIDVFLAEHPDVIVANAAGCGAVMKEYGELLAGDPDYAAKAKEFSRRVRDFTELVVELDGFEKGLGPLPVTATYHDACHLAHAQGIRTQPRQLLDAIPDLKRTELPESDWCCGSAGVYNITQSAMANRLLRRKLANIERTGASMVVAANPGCLIQIRAGVRRRHLNVEVLHPAEVMARSYGAAEEAR